MAKKNTLAELTIAGGILAAGALFGRKKKKEAEKAAEETRKAAEASRPSQGCEMTYPGEEAQPSDIKERACPSCGNRDNSGSRNCPVCFASMDPDPQRDDP